MKPLVYKGSDRVAYLVLLAFFAVCILTRIFF